jgi:hypothetical protein
MNYDTNNQKLFLTAKVLSLKLVEDKHSPTGKHDLFAKAKLKIGNGELYYDALISKVSKSIFLYNSVPEFQNEQEYIDSEKKKVIENIFNSKNTFVIDPETVMEDIEEKFNHQLGQINGMVKYLMVESIELFTLIKNNEELGIKTVIDFTELKELFLAASKENSEKKRELKIEARKKYYEADELVINLEKIKAGLVKGITAELNYDNSAEYASAKGTDDIIITFHFEYEKDDTTIESDSIVAKVEPIYNRSAWSNRQIGTAIKLREGYDHVANYKKIDSLVKKVNEKYEIFMAKAEMEISKKSKEISEERWFEENFDYPVIIKKETKYNVYGGSRSRNNNKYEVKSYSLIHSVGTETTTAFGNVYELGYGIKFHFDTEKLTDKSKFIISEFTAEFSGKLESEKVFIQFLYSTGEYYKSGMNLSSFKFTKNQFMDAMKKFIEYFNPCALDGVYSSK